VNKEEIVQIRVGNQTTGIERKHHGVTVSGCQFTVWRCREP